MAKTRLERDFLGEREIPEAAYWGVQTSRAIENFPISGLRAHPEFIRAMAMIKKAAAMENAEVGRLDRTVADAIIRAAEEILSGKFLDQFVVDIYQSGAGTSFHMNMNEILANRASELLGGRRGEYALVHPNDHVNMGQSTNDVFPTAMRLAALQKLGHLYSTLGSLIDVLEAKSFEFRSIVKSGRTHLQDATPLTLGQEFGGYGESVRRCKRHLENSADSLRDLGIGGTAVGTGAVTHPRYRKGMITKLTEILQTGTEKACGIDDDEEEDVGHTPLRLAGDTFEAMQSNAPFSIVSGALRSLALELIRIANDLRLLCSGPATGLGEIELPAVQPGSSIMPGKVNPVMAEMLAMVCFQVIGNDLAISTAVQAGQLELNVMMPLINFNLLQSIEILTNGVRVFTDLCVRGIKANAEVCREYALKSTGLATLLRPLLGYHKASELAQEALRTRKSVADLAIERGLLTREQLEEMISPERLQPDK